MIVINYDLEEYPFPELVNQIFGVRNLMFLHRRDFLDRHSGDVPGADQQSPWHDAFYRACEDDGSPFLELYQEFVNGLIVSSWSPGETCYIQRVPTFRISLPGGRAVGGVTHRDRDYGHPQGEKNFVLPLTHMMGTNSLFTESKDGLGDFNFQEIQVGQYLQFDGCNCRHGNVANTTGFTRVSIDFRILPKSLYNREQEGRSRAHGLSFRPGDYYA